MRKNHSHNVDLPTGTLSSALRSKIGRILFILFIIAIPIFRFDLVLSSFLSLMLTVLHSIIHFQLDPVYFRSALFEFWIAFIAWISMLVLGFWFLIQKKGNTLLAEKLFSAVVPASAPNKSTVKRSTFGIYCLAVFFGIALLGPFLAPLDPINQGDLETTRFLAPLQTADAWEEVPELDSAIDTYGLLERSLRNANNRLLAKRVEYTRSNENKQGQIGEKASYRVLFLFGTDALGRDVFSRVIYGTRISLGIGIIVAALSMLLGTMIGFLSGLLGGIADKFMMRILDIFLSLPPLVFIISLFSVLGGSIEIMIIALALSGWMGVARLVRGEVLKLREQEFILAAKILGVSTAGIIRNHLIPNILPTILTASVLQFINSIMGEAALSFLGLGIPPPTASWGNMIGESIIYLRTAWWIGIFPGIALSLFAISAQLVAEGVQDGQK